MCERPGRPSPAGREQLMTQQLDASPGATAALSRRTFVGASALGVAGAAASQFLPAAPGLAAEAVAGNIPYVGAGSNAPVRPFWLGQVSLGPGLLQEKRDRMKEWLRQYDERR